MACARGFADWAARYFAGAAGEAADAREESEPQLLRRSGSCAGLWSGAFACLALPRVVLFALPGERVGLSRASPVMAFRVVLDTAAALASGE